jgi:hypothetical protein
MQQVKVRKEELLEKLKYNRGQHVQMFLDSMEGYREQVVEACEELLKQARGNKDVTLGNLSSLRKPRNHEKDYNLAVQMLTMSVDDEIMLEQEEFDNLVMDAWDWSQEFSSSNMMYSNKFK